jgi:phosphotransferase system HPr (HPr) family protein
MVSEDVVIRNQLGLHARAAAKLVRAAASYRSRILLLRGDNAVQADAKSILSVLTLAASFGTKLTIQCEGDDEIGALAEMRELFESGFGEE